MAERAELRLLIVDDDPLTARLMTRVLRAHGFADPAHVTTAAAAPEAATLADVVLLDHQLPDASGFDVIDALRAVGSRPAIVMVTAHGNEALAASALRRGVDDYVVKDAALSEVLPRVVERVRRTRALRDALDAAERDLVRAERLAAIGQMTVTLHHEINNPLMAAATELELLLADPDLPEPHRAGATRVKEAVARIGDIVRRSRTLGSAEPSEYVRGVEMIKLAGAAAPALATRGAAQLWVPEEDLARIAGMLLRHAGFAVSRAHSATELQTRSRAIGTAIVVVLGSTLAPLGGFVPEAERDYRLVALVSDDGAAARAAGADLAVSLPFDPAQFSADVGRLADSG